MYCSNCGKEVTGKFCSNCGTPIIDSSLEMVSAPTDSLKNIPLDEPFYQLINGRTIDLHAVIVCYGGGTANRMIKSGAYAYLTGKTGISTQEAKEILDPLYEKFKGEKFSFHASLKAQAKLNADEKDAKASLIKVCLNCGSNLLGGAQKCPTCGANRDRLQTVDPSDKELISTLVAEAPNASAKTKPQWMNKTDAKLALYSAKDIKSEQKKAERERVKQLERDKIPMCPKCKSTSLTANKKGYGIGKGVVGGLVGTAVAGPVGLLGLTAGNIGAKKVRVTCLNCGNQFYL